MWSSIVLLLEKVVRFQSSADGSNLAGKRTTAEGGTVTRTQTIPGGENSWRLDLGASPLDGRRTRFRVWAPKAGELSVRLFIGDKSVAVRLREEGDGYFSGTVSGCREGARYYYLFADGTEHPDPVSRFQPEGVHGPSQVVDPAAFPWSDGGWKGTALEEFVIYELHVGAFTREGSFAAVIPCLDRLRKLGITAVELMPVAQFPGERNWGYDGVYPYAPQNSYGGPDGLKSLIDACHRKGLAVILDVVYNHLGPEGNYLGCFGHYFTGRYRTPWGEAINFDGPYSDEVRRYFVGNALYWVTEYHVDSLRVDAVHGIFDFSARHFLQEMAEAVHAQAKALGRAIHVIAESSLNDVRTIIPPEFGGYGFDAQWNDDFHHALRTVLTGEREGYYMDFGEFSQLATAFREGFVYSGQYSRYRKRRHGSSSLHLPPRKFVVFSQNHDQVGNRVKGDRPSAILTLEKLKLAAGTVILSPYLPLIFMGEEYDEPAPFQYFTSHSDPALVEAVRRGRNEEFASFAWEGEAPDPQAEATFLRSKIDPAQRRKGVHAVIYRFYRRLLELRRTIAAFRSFNREGIEVASFEKKKVLAVRRRAETSEAVCLFNFGDAEQEMAGLIAEGRWEKLLDSSAPEWGGVGEMAPSAITATEAANRIMLPPFSLVVYQNCFKS